MEIIALFQRHHRDRYVVKPKLTKPVSLSHRLCVRCLTCVHEHDTTGPSRDYFHNHISPDGWKTQ